MFIQQFVTTNTNPYKWDVSAAQVTSPVVSMILYDNSGQEIVVDDLREPIQIEITTGVTNESPALVTPFLSEDAELYYHAIETSWNSTQALGIIISPLARNDSFEIFLKHGSRPTLLDYDRYYRFPEESLEREDDEENSAFKIFVHNETVSSNETDVLFLGLRLFGK